VVNGLLVCGHCDGCFLTGLTGLTGWFGFGFGILFILFILSKFIGIFYPQMTQIYTDEEGRGIRLVRQRDAAAPDWHLCESV